MCTLFGFGLPSTRDNVAFVAFVNLRTFQPFWSPGVLSVAWWGFSSTVSTELLHFAQPVSHHKCRFLAQGNLLIMDPSSDKEGQFRECLAIFMKQFVLPTGAEKQ